MAHFASLIHSEEGQWFRNLIYDQVYYPSPRLNSWSYRAKDHETGWFSTQTILKKSIELTRSFLKDEKNFPKCRSKEPFRSFFKSSNDEAFFFACQANIIYCKKGLKRLKKGKEFYLPKFYYHESEDNLRVIPEDFFGSHPKIVERIAGGLLSGGTFSNRLTKAPALGLTEIVGWIPSNWTLTCDSESCKQPMDLSFSIPIAQKGVFVNSSATAGSISRHKMIASIVSCNLIEQQKGLKNLPHAGMALMGPMQAVILFLCIQMSSTESLPIHWKPCPT